MKKILLLYLTCLSLIGNTLQAQNQLPYSTGFDNDAEQDEWTQYRIGEATGPYEWHYTTQNPKDSPNALAHNYPVGGEEVTEDWLVSPALDFSNGGTIDSIWHAFSGFGTPSEGDTIALYLLTGDQNPELATSRTRLILFSDSTYENDNVWRFHSSINVPTTTEKAYIGFQYMTIINWLDVKFDKLVISGDSNCPAKYDTISPTGCNSYTAPSGDESYTKSGTYMDTLTTSNGCDSILTIQLTINHVDTSISQKGDTLTSNADSATYQWLDCENSFAPINGENNADFRPGSTGSYAVEVTSQGCTDTSYCYMVRITSAVLNNFESPFHYYPNPTSGNLQIDLGQHYDKVKAIIKTLSGKILKEKVVDNVKMFDLNIEGEQGYYFVDIINPNGSEKSVLKILKK